MSSVIEAIQSLRNFFTISKKNLKRKIENSESDVHPKFKKRIKFQPYERNQFCCTPKNLDKIRMEPKHNTLFAEYEFSDDSTSESEFNNDDNERLKRQFFKNTNYLKSYSPKNNHCRHFSENNYEESPKFKNRSQNKMLYDRNSKRQSEKIFRVPAEYQQKVKKNVPPLLHMDTIKILNSTCLTPLYSNKKPEMKTKTKLEENGIGNLRNTKTETINNHKEPIQPNYKTNSNSLISKYFDLEEKEKYFCFLTKFIPNLYKKDDTKEENKNNSNFESSNFIDLTRKNKLNYRHNVPEVIDEIDLVSNESDENEQLIPHELIDLSYDDDMQIMVNLKYGNSKSSLDSKEEKPKVKPINSVKQILDLDPKFKENWLKNIKREYKNRRTQIKQQIIEQELYADKLLKETAKREENILQERLKNISIQREPIIYEFIDLEEEKEEEEFPKFSENDINLLEKSISGGPPNETLISKFNMNITRQDIHTLIGNSWLNDEVINFYMNLLMQRSEERNDLPKVYAMNTFFVPRLLQSGHSGVRRWTRKVDLFSYDIIPVPVHVGNVHWCMAIIHLKNKTIKYYDSMGQANPTLINYLEQYLKEESLDKRKTAFDTSNFIKESVADIPKQMNGSDCGVFSCMFAEYITRNKEITFAQQHMQYFRQKMILEIVKGRLLL